MLFFVNIVNIVTCSNLVELCCIDRHLYLDVLAIGSGFGCRFFLHVLVAGFGFMISL